MNCNQCGERMKMGFFARTICKECVRDNERIKRESRLQETGRIEARNDIKDKERKRKQFNKDIGSLRKRMGYD